MIGSAGRDLRHAMRTIARTPLLSAVIILSLALGIGANTVVFSWIQARLLDPLPGVPGGARFQAVEPRQMIVRQNQVGRTALECREEILAIGDQCNLRFQPLVAQQVGDETCIGRIGISASARST